VGVLKGVLILQRKFAMVGESEPIVITNSGAWSTPAVLYRGKALTRCFGMGSVICGTDVERKKLPSCSKF
jgi:hypothetical protein